MVNVSDEIVRQLFEIIYQIQNDNFKLNQQLFLLTNINTWLVSTIQFYIKYLVLHNLDKNVNPLGAYLTSELIFFNQQVYAKSVKNIEESTKELQKFQQNLMIKFGLKPLLSTQPTIQLNLIDFNDMYSFKTIQESIIKTKTYLLDQTDLNYNPLDVRKETVDNILFNLYKINPIIIDEINAVLLKNNLNDRFSVVKILNTSLVTKHLLTIFEALFKEIPLPFIPHNAQDIKSTFEIESLCTSLKNFWLSSFNTCFIKKTVNKQTYYLSDKLKDEFNTFSEKMGDQLLTQTTFIKGFEKILDIKTPSKYYVSPDVERFRNIYNEEWMDLLTRIYDKFPDINKQQQKNLKIKIATNQMNYTNFWFNCVDILQDTNNLHINYITENLTLKQIIKTLIVYFTHCKKDANTEGLVEKNINLIYDYLKVLENKLNIGK